MRVWNGILFGNDRLSIIHITIARFLCSQRLWLWNRSDEQVYKISNRAKNQRFAGCQFLTVEAYATTGYSAVGFYNNCGFTPSELKNPNKDTLRMFMTLYSKES